MLEEVDVSRSGQEPNGSRSAFRRADAYMGVAKEVGWLAFNAALWPVGLLDEGLRAGLRKIRVGKAETDPKPLTKPSEDAAAVPIVLIHGYFHNRSGMMIMRRSLKSHGFRNVHYFSYNPLKKTVQELATELRERIEEIRNRTGAPKLHLVGHSLGGIIARYYVEEMGGDNDVHTLVTLGTPHHGTMVAKIGRSPVSRQIRPGSQFMKMMDNSDKPQGVRYYSYYSDLDALVIPSSSAILDNGDGSDVHNILVHDKGHMSLLISAELIESIADNLSELNGDS